MPQKLGRSGAGLENYDAETGKYVETLTYNDKKEEQQKSQEPSRFVQNEPKSEVKKPVFNNLTALNKEEKEPQEIPYNYAKAIDDQAKLYNPNYFDEHGTPEDYNEEPTEKQMEILQKASADFHIPMDSILEAFKNYSLNRDVYGRSAFMNMIKNQYKKREAEAKRKVVENLAPEYYNKLQSIKANGGNIIKELNDKYVSIQNEKYTKPVAERQKIIKDYSVQRDNLRLQLAKETDPKKQKNIQRSLTDLDNRIGINNSLLRVAQDRAKRNITPNIKNIQDINNLFYDDPVKIMKIINSIAESFTVSKQEEEKAMKLLKV